MLRLLCLPSLRNNAERVSVANPKARVSHVPRVAPFRGIEAQRLRMPLRPTDPAAVSVPVNGQRPRISAPVPTPKFAHGLRRAYN